MNKPALDRLEAVESIVSLLVAGVESRYGISSKSPLAYHNLTHTQDVMSAALSIGSLAVNRGRIPASYLDLLMLGSTGHDIFQLLGAGINEDDSAAYVCALMSGNFPEAEISLVEAMIKSTKIVFADGVMSQQIADFEDPDLSHILADADLVALGMPTNLHWNRVKGLMMELSKTSNPTREQRIAFLENQQRLLSGHRYFTREARELFWHQTENLALTERLLVELG